MALITPAHAANLRSFVYVGKDNSILYNYALSDWAQFLVDRATPPWVAPNTITLLGLFATLFATVVAFAHAPDLGATSISPWVAVLLAFCMFAYSTLDNMDGKQARKTKSSSALGLLFDHGAPTPARARRRRRINPPPPPPPNSRKPHPPPPLHTHCLRLRPRRLRRHQCGPDVVQHRDGVGHRAGLVAPAVLVLYPHSALFLQHVGGDGAGCVRARALPGPPPPRPSRGQAPTSPSPPPPPFPPGEFILPVINGPNEGIFLTISLLLLQGVKGQEFTWRSPVPGWPALRPVVALAQPLVRLGRWLDGDPQPARDLVSMDIILAFVFYGVLLTVALNVAAVAGRARRAGLPPWLPPALLAELPAAFIVLMGGVTAWLFSEGTRALAQRHWALTCGVATVLSVEMNTRVMLAFTAKDAGLLSRALHLRVLAFAAAPLAVRLGTPGALGVERDAFAAAALLLCGVAALLPCVRFIFAACTQVAAALGIATFSLERPAAGAEAGAEGSSVSGSASSGGGGRRVRGKSPAKGGRSGTPGKKRS
jgi:hypothetical protein